SVGQLAAAQVLASAGAPERDRNLASGSGTVEVTFTLANDETRTISVDAAKSSLEDIVKAINADSELGVSATLMNDGDPDNPHRLMISANDTGTENRLTSISVAPAEGSGATVGGLKAVLAFPPDGGVGMNEIVAAEDAEIVINGITVKSQSNTIENAIEGVTLTLSKEAAEGATPDTLRITRDDSVATTAVNNFVSAYNALQSTI